MKSQAKPKCYVGFVARYHMGKQLLAIEGECLLIYMDLQLEHNR